MEKTLYYFFAVIFLFINTDVFSSEFIDIATCIEDRTQQYGLNGYERAIVLSPYRTGSTFAFNILRFLFESEEMKYNLCWDKEIPQRKVYKRHYFEAEKAENIIVYTVRNPLDACFSAYRVSLGIDKTKQNLDDNIRDLVTHQMSLWYEFEPILSSPYIFLLLRYEDFVNNIDHVFEKLESFFCIVIAEQDKALLREALSKENVAENVKEFKEFDQTDPYSLLHGYHIELGGMSNGERRRVNRAILRELTKHKRIIEKWGYAHILE
ncbi:MAG: sulfotransferase domain-containing protein [Parachlamydiaceae bacterium]